MALVAYSDDSDLCSDSEDTEQQINGIESGIKRDILPEVTSKISVAQPNSNLTARPIPDKEPKVFLGVDDIVDEDELEDITSTKSKSLLSSIPAAIPIGAQQGDVGEREDELDDVPTVSTWKITAEIQKGKDKSNSQSVTSSSDESTLERPKKKAKSKVKFFVPALSEFDEDEEEEPKKEPERKKVMPSVKGTGLFSVLPEPKHISVKETKRPLIPHVLTKPPPKQKPLKPKPAPKLKMETSNDSDEEDASPSDFFSLSEPASSFDAVPPIPVTVTKTSVPEVPVLQSSMLKTEGLTKNTQQQREPRLPIESRVNEPQLQEGVSYALESESQLAGKPSGIDQEALIRLTGKRRGKGEEINFIDVSADDALLTRDEWMTKALTEEKPSHSFSKKKEGLPSQKQKQKHQITYLAHQAKERELELKNNWAQNRMTKMQTQAKYGF